jgi:branched-chain amino acid transport system permease protein
MSEVITFIVLGFSSGAIYCGISLGLVSVYFASGVLNFGQAAIAMWGAYVFATLRTTGDLVFPIGTIHLASSVGTVEAAIIAVATSVILGAIVHLVIFRPLRRYSALAQIAASVGVLVTLTGLVTVRFSTNGIQVPQMLPAGVISVGGARLSEPDLILLGLAVAFCLALGAYFRWTTAGVATRAAAVNEDALGLMGYSPHLLDASAWTIASVASTLLLILASPETSLTPSAAYYVVPGLAILLVARMKSVAIIGVASMVLGCAQSLLTLGSSYPWWPAWGQSGLQDGLPFIVAIVVLFAMGDRLGTRHVSPEGGLPDVRLPKRPAVTLVGIAAVAVVALLVTSGPTRFGVITSLVITVLILSYTVLTGYLGQISFAQMAFAGSAGFLLSKLTTSWGIGFPLGLLVAALFAAIIGVVIGIAALRFRGAQLAIVTLAAAVAVQGFVFDNGYFISASGNPVNPPSLFGYSLSAQSGHQIARLRFGFLVLVILILAVGGLLRWARGHTGRAWLAVRSNERAAASAGINVTTTKITGFALSAFLAGVAGCLIGYSQGQLSTGSFEVDTGILLFATAFLGGITSISGAVVAGAIAPLGLVYVLLNNHINFGEYYPLIAGIGLIITVLLNPEGIVGAFTSQMQAVGRLLSRKIRTPALVGIASPNPADENRPAVSGKARELKKEEEVS